jgi:DNA-binding CsgD family transcriptional regulator
MTSHRVIGAAAAPLVPAGPAVPLQAVGALLSHVGVSGRDAVAEDLLRLLGAEVPLAQCTIFAYEGLRRPRVVAIGDRSRTRSLAHITEAYINRFHRLDGCRDAMREHLDAARRSPVAQPLIVLHCQRPQDIAHAEYRKVCYSQPRIAERVSLLSLHEQRYWIAVNFYRGAEHGPMDERGLQTLEAFAPLVVHAVRLHHTGQVLHDDVGELLLARLQQRVGALTPRELDVARGLLSGQGSAALADTLGLSTESVRTYCKRLYRKLGVSGQREWMALLLEPAGPPG